MIPPSKPSFILLVTANTLYAQTAGSPAIVHPEHYWGDESLFLEKQAGAILDIVSEALTSFPPQLPEPIERQMALLMLDGVLHDVEAPKRPPVHAFYHDRIEKALTEMKGMTPESGAVVWKLYDHGFIVRTKTVTVGFDLIRGYSAKADGFALSDPIMERLVGQCDILFISHRHRDHADEWVAQAFIDSGKPVVTPPEIWADKPINGKIMHLIREAHTRQEVVVKNGQQALDVVVYPGHQGDLTNNVTLVYFPEGITVCHTGDQANDSDFSWIDRAGEHHRADILLPNCWTTDIVRLADGFDAGVVITGHENELGHSIDHREPYWLTYRRFAKSIRPLVLMTWGESYHFQK